MTKVICDTNIWYELASGKINYIKSDKYELYCTYISLHELIHTQKLIIDFEKAKSACNAVLSYAQNYILESPYEHLKNLLQPKVLVKSETNFIEAIKNLSKLEKLNDDEIKVLNSFLLSKNNILENDFVTYISDHTNARKSHIYKDKSSENKYKQLFKRKDIKQLTLSNLEKQIKNELGEELFSETFWHQIEFYLKSRLKYFNKLKIDKCMKPEKNDAFDMANLMYVNEGCLYWTEDKRWLNIFREAKLENYLFINEIGMI